MTFNTARINVVLSRDQLCFRHMCTGLQLSQPQPQPSARSSLPGLTELLGSLPDMKDRTRLSHPCTYSPSRLTECGLIKSNTANRKDGLKQSEERIFRTGKTGGTEEIQEDKWIHSDLDYSY